MTEERTTGQDGIGYGNTDQETAGIEGEEEILQREEEGIGDGKSTFCLVSTSADSTT